MNINYQNMKIRIIAIITLIISLSSGLQSQTTKEDSLTIRIESLEDELANQNKKLELSERELQVLFKEKQMVQDTEFNSLSNKLKEDYDLIKQLSFWGLGLTVSSLIALFFGGKKYIQGKLNEKFDKIISEQESNIIEIVESHDIEKRILRTRTAVVLTAENEDEAFIKNFFNKIGFNRDNITFKKVNNHQDIGEVDLIFVNNDNDHFESSLIDDYFNNSSDNTVLFYYNTTRKTYNNNSVSNRMSFANSPTQIYGNMINLMKYQQVIS